MDKWSQIYKNEGKSYKYYNLYQHHESMEELAETFKKHKIKKILDLGCGVGRNLIYLAKAGFDLSGIDLSKEGIKQLNNTLKKENIKADLAVGDVYKKLPYEDNHFDAIISIQVLQHSNEDDILKCITEIYRILKPGGLLFVTLCGRYSQGKVRQFLVKTAKRVSPHTYSPTEGSEVGLTHFIYNKSLIMKHFRDFKITKLWKDSKDYYCFLAVNKKDVVFDN